MKQNRPGLLRCARYSFAPNHFHYCGPEKQNDLQDYVMLHESDQGLQEILSDFDTLYKYLAMIAYENNIRDQFDSRVVEAYWLGNSLLRKTKYEPLSRLLTDSLQLKQKLTPAQLQKTLSTLDQGVAHHTFHVLNIFKRTGHLPIAHTLETMDACRINWGKIVQSDGGKYLIEILPLVIQKDMLGLGKSVVKTVESIGLAPKVGEWVSVHWGYVCEVLMQRQLANLKFYTNLAIQLANKNQVIPSETK